jgi:GT2 family glycosyltransferase
VASVAGQLSATFAVAVPTRDRPEYLARLLLSLSEQTRKDWILVVNDSSATPVEQVGEVRKLLSRLGAHSPCVIRTAGGHDRHQRGLLAVPAGIEIIVRVDDDVVLAPTFLDKVLETFDLFAGEQVAAVGGCCPEEHLPVRDLDVQLCDPRWLPTVDEPTWRLQGHSYHQSEVLEVESLQGCAMAYRRSALEAVGGWAVEGYSRQAHREESDASARLRMAGCKLLVRTDALGLHLYAPSGGSRQIAKGPNGNVLISDPAPIEADERLFRQRLASWKAAGLQPGRHRRYRVSELRRGWRRGRPMLSWRGRVLSSLRRFGAWLAPRTRLRRWWQSLQPGK